MSVTRLVLTGVNGFIGNQILERAIKLLPSEWGLPQHHCFEIVGADLLESQTRFTAKRFAGSARYTFLSHSELLSKLESGDLSCDLVIHNGACSSTVEKDPSVFETLNLGYSRRLWDVCAGRNIPFIYASSASVYGDGQLGFDDSPAQTQNYTALNLYAQSKLDFDLHALKSTRQPRLWAGLRYFNVYGPFEAHKEGQASMVLHGFHQMMKSGEIRLFKGTGSGFGDGEQKRDFVWVGDIVDMTFDLCRRMMVPELSEQLLEDLSQISGKGRKGCFLNVGTGEARTWNSLAKAIFYAVEREPKISYIDMPESLQKQYQNYTQATHETASRLGITRQWTSLEQGVSTYVRRTLARQLG